MEGRGQIERLGPRPQERELLRRWHEDRDVAARDALAEAMLPLARNLARRYANRGEPLDDLEQVACVGLMKAIDRFDPAREVRFATFAVPTIAGEIKRHFRDRGWMVRVPRDVQELSARLSRAAREAHARPRPRADVMELAAGAEASEERVMEALSAADAYRDAVARRAAGGGRRRAGGDRRRRRGVRAHGAAHAAAQRHGRAGRPRARDPAAAVLRRAHPARDRRARRDLADARVAAAAPLAGGHARGVRAPSVARGLNAQRVARRAMTDERTQEEQEKLDRRWLELLNELRVAMPGVQVLFAFLLAVPFQQGFQRSTTSSARRTS